MDNSHTESKMKTFRARFLRDNPDLTREVLKIQSNQRGAQDIIEFDRKTRKKVYALQGTTFAFIATSSIWISNWYLAALAIIVLGTFAMPYIRVFMHSEFHWGLGGTTLERRWFRNFISLTFSVPQRGYEIGHRIHHRYDNDFSNDGRPRDPQSTYIFARNGSPSNPFLWIIYYAFLFQHMVLPYLVVKNGKNTDIASYFFQLSGIISLHVIIFLYAKEFYLLIYLPSTVISWFGSAIVLYMMHDVSLEGISSHPTNNSASQFFNWFGDNDGFHLEHHVFAGVHPARLREVHDIVRDNIPDKQILPNHYATEFFKRHVIGGVE
ncbi:fatty acid desaturase [Marinobacter sp. LN3S78]|uniref:fatty acid desaturase n=1 Tax=Marinobacter sp. LN3S78 TaxID=3382300 RepID=UPI00387AAFD6